MSSNLFSIIVLSFVTSYRYILGQNTYSDDEDEEEEEEMDDEEEEYVPPVHTNKKRISILDDDEDEEVKQMKEVIGFSNNAVKDGENTDNDTNDDIYDMETDNENSQTTTDDKKPIRNDSQSNCDDISSDPKAIDIFKAKSFCFYGPFDENEKQILTQYIITHSGSVLLSIVLSLLAKTPLFCYHFSYISHTYPFCLYIVK